MKKGLMLLMACLMVAVTLVASLGCGAKEEEVAGPTGEGNWWPSASPEAASRDQSGASFPSYYPSSSNSQQAGIWVTGTGTVTVVPDLALLTLGVEAQASTVAEARAQAAGAMSAIMAALAANGVAEKDIKTQWYNIYPVRKWVDETREEVLIGYRVTNTVAAKIRDVDNAGVVIDAVVEAGGDLTRIQGISFTVEDPKPYYTEARQEAILDAIAKAQQMASVAGVGLGKPTYITESGGYYPPPVPYPARAEAMADVTTPISAGETEVSLTVQMVFDIVAAE